MRCRLCYNLERDYEKSFEEITADLEAGLKMRNVFAVTILGGEPTIYPRLADVIAHVKSRGLFCGLLTNGLRFLEPGGPDLIRRIRQAGLDRVFLHVDSGQRHVHPDIEAAREKMFSLLEAARLPFALSVTIYGGEKHVTADIVRRYSRFRYFEGILSFLAREPEGQRDPRLDLREVYDSLRNELGLEPLSFLPAHASGEDVRWLMYFYVVNTVTGRAFSVSSKVQRFAKTVFRWGIGRQFFGQTLGPAYIRASLIPIVLAELIFSPRRAGQLARLLRVGRAEGGKRRLGLPRLRDFRAQLITAQSPPVIDFATRHASICRGCPDATVRGGKLVPVCIADLVSPFHSSTEARLACPDI